MLIARPSVVYLSRLSVTFVRQGYSAGWIFPQFFFAVWYLGHPLTFTENFTGTRPRGTPPSGYLNARGVAKYSDFWHFEFYISQTGQDSINHWWYVLYELSIGTKIGDLEWPWTAKWPLFCVILPYLVVFGAHCVNVIDKAITTDNSRLLCLVVNVCRGTARRLRYKYSITARWKFCRRFINSRLNAQYRTCLAIVKFAKQTRFSLSVFWSTCAISSS